VTDKLTNAKTEPGLKPKRGLKTTARRLQTADWRPRLTWPIIHPFISEFLSCSCGSCNGKR